MLNLDIKLIDGTALEVTAIAVDFVAWEAKFDLSVSKFQANLKLTHMMFLGWHVLKRTKQTELDFDAWLETVESVGVVETKK